MVVSFITRLLFILIISLGLANCGFQLRGDLSPPLPVIAIRTDTKTNSLFHQVLPKLLSSMGIRIDSAKAPIILEVLSQDLQRQATNFSAIDETKRYILVCILRYQLINQAGALIVAPQTLRANRSLVIRAGQINGDLNNQCELEMSLYRDITQQIVDHLVAYSSRDLLQSNRALA